MLKIFPNDWSVV